MPFFTQLHDTPYPTNKKESLIEVLKIRVFCEENDLEDITMGGPQTLGYTFIVDANSLFKWRELIENELFYNGQPCITILEEKALSKVRTLWNKNMIINEIEKGYDSERTFTKRDRSISRKDIELNDKIRSIVLNNQHLDPRNKFSKEIEEFLIKKGFRRVEEDEKQRSPKEVIEKIEDQRKMKEYDEMINWLNVPTRKNPATKEDGTSYTLLERVCNLLDEVAISSMV